MITAKISPVNDIRNSYNEFYDDYMKLRNDLISTNSTSKTFDTTDIDKDFKYMDTVAAETIKTLEGKKLMTMLELKLNLLMKMEIL